MEAPTLESDLESFEAAPTGEPLAPAESGPAPRESACETPIGQWRRRIKQQRALRVGLTITTVAVGVGSAVAGVIAAAARASAEKRKG